MRFFDISRGFRDRFHVSWMTISLVVIMILPFILFFGLLFKSTLILSNHSLVDLLFSSNWQPMRGEYRFSALYYQFHLGNRIININCRPGLPSYRHSFTQYARNYVLRIMHPIIDILAGIPSVIFGVWGILIIVPFVGNYLGPWLGKEVSGYSILAGAVVLAIMIIPFILNILIEIFRTIPIELTEASLSVGATKWQTIKFVMIKRALPGIISAFGLGISRAFGETIAVLMVVGNVVKIPTGTFQPGYPLPALIANNYGEMLSIPQYDSALMLAALILFVVVIIFNFASRSVIMRYEKAS